MRLFRWALVAILVVVLGVAIQQTLLWLGMWGSMSESQVKPLDDGDQEIALIEPATSSDDWGRLVTAAQLLEADWQRINPTLPSLKVIAGKNAFPPLTTEVPEIAIALGDSPRQHLRLRWYKISGEHDAASWVQKLHARARPPLAIIGGGTSDRAVRLARALQKTYENPDQPSPLFLITTATAEKTGSGKSLIGLYPQRTFRFSFTNRKMVEALLQFVQRRQFPDDANEWGAGNLWANKFVDPQPLAGALTGAIRGTPFVQPHIMHAVAWQDERYSLDMHDLFDKEFKKRFPLGEFSDEGTIPSGFGGFSHPAPQEQATIATILARPTPIAPNSFLVLPTQTVRMRRVLINLRQRSPQDARNLVILNGDAIGFNAIYRDRDVLWNVLDLPYSLVFFSHRNPIDRAAGFRGPFDKKSATPVFPTQSATGTQDVLLYRDLLEAFLYAAHDSGHWLSDPIRVRERMKLTCWYHPIAKNAKDDLPRVCNPEVHPLDAEHRRLFDADGNRQSQTGEHIIWLKPSFSEDRVDLKSTISVWAIRPDRNGGVWYLPDGNAFPAFYNQGDQP